VKCPPERGALDRDQQIRTQLLQALAQPEVTVRGVGGRAVGEDTDRPAVMALPRWRWLRRRQSSREGD